MPQKTFLMLPPLAPPAATATSTMLLAAKLPAPATPPPTSLHVAGTDHAVKVLDTTPHGTRLIQMDADAGASLAGTQTAGGYRIFENRIYRPMAVTTESVRPTLPIGAPSPALTPAMVAAAVPAGVIHVPVVVTDAATCKPVQSATVMFFQDQAAGKGSTAVTDATGHCSVPWLQSLETIEQLWVMPPNPPVYWGHYAAAVPLKPDFAIAMTPVDPAYRDGARHYWPDPVFDPSKGITVAVVDTGVAASAALNLVGGANTVEGEDAGDFGSNGDPHGTHVAGLVGAHGVMQGNAPGVGLRSYRVFGSGGAGATSFAIIKAIALAVSDGCDVVNLSLGVDGDDPPLHETIRHARDAGVLVVAAGNNNHGGPVGSPASYPETVGVSAIGQLGCIPPGAQPMAFVTPMRGHNKDCFFAGFSCVGPAVKLSAPGVGIVSTVPGDTYGQMSGTSMASPLLAGHAASLLARHPDILAAPRDRARSDALEAALIAKATSLGLTADQEGHGLPGSG